MADRAGRPTWRTIRYRRARRARRTRCRKSRRKRRRAFAILTTRGLATRAEIAAARAAARDISASFGEVLLARGVVWEAELLSALARQARTTIVDLDRSPPVPDAEDLLPSGPALAAQAVPLRLMGSRVLIATSRPDLIDMLHKHLPKGLRPIPLIASRAQILAAQLSVYGEMLARRAEARAPVHLSCRGWHGERRARWIAAACAFVLAAAVAAPLALLSAAFLLALLVFCANLALKTASLIADTRAPHRAPAILGPARTARRPVVSLLVPLYHEDAVLPHLVARLGALDYPRERLEVIFCLEADDRQTAEALARLHLPPNMWALTVPPGTPRTKPRALNFALHFARGDVIGIYDAEDRPAPDQIERIVATFARTPPEVACLQGQLDYYNSRHNLLARMFTIEYASWFRVLLPGVERLGLVVPLGGTTLFVRRNALEAVGAWDAHNVTGDLELGLRLARAGYRTRIVATTTYEEANAALLPWIRQRSRWLKGYLVTWATAMRAPRALWRDLGPWRFLGLQVQMFCGVLGFLLAPLLWSLIVKVWGAAHPLDAVMPPHGYLVIGALMILGLLIGQFLCWRACRAAHLRSLRPAGPLTEIYYMLGTVAAWIAAVEMACRPYFWAKTTHGGFGTPPGGEDGAVSPPARHPP